MVRLVLTKVDVMKLHAIDVQKSTFHAQMWIELVCPQGALDPDLAREPLSQAYFPTDHDGKPTFKPSLAWFAAQVDMRSALQHRVVDSKVTRRGNDLMLAMRFDGVFHEVFELTDFPLDEQGLSIHVSFNCRVGGPLPMELVVDPKPVVTLSCIHICPPAKEWTISHSVRMRSFKFGEMYSRDRVFPSMSVTVRVRRQPNFVIINLMIPIGLISLLALLQGAVTGVAELNHRAQLTAVMVLIATTNLPWPSTELPRPSAERPLSFQ